MNTKKWIIFLCILTVGLLTACGKAMPPTSSNPTENTNQVYENRKTSSDMQSEEDPFAGPYYGIIKKVDSTSIEIEMLSTGEENAGNPASDHSAKDEDTQQLNQQAQKSENPVDFQSNGEILSAAFASTIQISNAGKTVLDLKEGDMISFYTNDSANREVVSIHIMG